MGTGGIFLASVALCLVLALIIEVRERFF